MILDAQLQSQMQWDALIKRHGNRGALRQSGTDRPITVSVQEESPMERLGGVSNPLDRIALVSALDPDTQLVLNPPPSERDVLILDADSVPGLVEQFGVDEGDEVAFKIVAPPDSMGSSARTMYWRIKVRR